jgi:regulatory protein YycI of two-component signal transduction system YycFG
MKIVFKIIFVVVFLVLGFLLALKTSNEKTDFQSYAETCDSCYTKISHTHLLVSIPPQKTKTDSLKLCKRKRETTSFSQEK